MARLREWMARLWGTLRSRRADADLEAELRSHAALAADARRGSPGRPASLAAPVPPAGVAHAMDALRDQRGLPWLDDFARDLRHAARLLRHNPMFTAVAALSLALGIAVNSAIFSLADVLILRPLPVPNHDGVLTVTADGSENAYAGGFVAYPNYRDLRDRSRSFDGLAAYRISTTAFSRERDAARDVRIGMLVSDNFFAVLGIRPASGRSFAPDEARVPGRDAVVVLSDDFWKGSLAADPSVLNGVVWINGVAFQVIGIAPPAFTGPEPPIRPAFYLPAAMAPRLGPSLADVLDNREARSFHVKGRLRSGVSQRSAEAELAAIWRGLAEQFPAANAHRTVAVRTELEARIRSDPWDAVMLGLLLALSALVLIIACANVASLMLGRMRARSREMAIRLALGVSRPRLLRQLLTESLLLSALGCTVGLAFASGGIRFLQTIPGADQVVIDPQLDRRVLAFSVMAAAVSACLFGLGPARQSLATDPVPALKAAASDGRSRPRTVGRHLLVVSQIALSTVLLVTTGILLDGFRKVLVLDPGFRTDHVMMLTFDPSLVGYTPERTRSFYRDLVGRAQALPTVQSATLTSAIPLQPDEQDVEAVVPEGYPFPRGQESASTFAAVVDERYFSTMQVGIVRGRAFSAGDRAGGRGVAIVNEEFAKTYWPDQDPIGKRIRLPERHGAWLEIVGLTRTGKYTWVGETPTPFVYLPFAQQERTRMSLLVASTAADVAGLAGPLRDAVRTLDVNQPISNAQTLAHMYHERAILVPGIIAKTVTAIGLLGLTLTLVGLYGLVAYSVSRRTREIGIRMAVGAAGRDVLSMVLRQGLALSLTGIVVGGLGSIAAARALSAALVGLGAPHPAIYLVVPIGVIALTAAASYFPARRASRVDPLAALRYE